MLEMRFDLISITMAPNQLLLHLNLMQKCHPWAELVDVNQGDAFFVYASRLDSALAKNVSGWN
jgi:hypothetical protein